MSAPYIITGTAVGVGGPEDIPYRYEINQLKDKLHQFTLFVLAWEKIRGENYQPEAAQFQQIAGIHGMPYTPWIILSTPCSGDPDQVKQTVRGSWLGYCNHASILFPNWHRPYIMLLEQAIGEVAYGIAGKYAAHVGPTSELGKKWLQAAKQLRFPYWDWTNPSTGKSGIPEIFIQKEVTILKHDGTKCQHLNPLNHYAFTHPVDGFNNRLEVPEWQNLPDPHNPPQQLAYFKEWTRTYRRPNSSPINVLEDYKALNTDLKNPDPKQKGSWAQLTEDVSNMFVFPVDIPEEQRANAWDQFSNTTFQSGRPEQVGDKTVFHSPFNWHATPIEQPHNRVHLIVGGLGHMGDNDTAGFDPIFFLHHCNVDRLLSFWEYIYPDYTAGTEGYLDVDGSTRVPFVQGGGTYSELTNQEVDANTPLMPFRKADYTYWNGADTHSLDWFDPNQDPRYVQNKNYTYEPIGPVDLEKKNPTIKQRERMRGYLQRHFKFNPREKMGFNPDPLPVFHRVPGRGLRTAPFAADPEHPLSTKIEGYRHFVVEASLSQKYHTGSYTLVVQAEMNNHKIVIGSISVLARGNSASCGNCVARRATDVRVRGVITVPHEIVRELVTAVSAQAAQEVEDEDVPAYGTPEAKQLVKNMLISLSSHVVLAGGTKHGQLSKKGGLIPRGPVDPTAPALRLLSSDVHTVQDQEDAPFNLENWQDHGSPYGEWVKKED
ncbi:tyrosinase [Ceratobasidium sp. AG-Ba]|nr:tyrosinase [Ceratobasidium sp. AG-Ba]